MIERYIPLGKAARQLGVHRQTLRKWLEIDCGLVFRSMGRGNSPLIAERDLEAVIAKRTGARNWAKARRVS